MKTITGNGSDVINVSSRDIAGVDITIEITAPASAPKNELVNLDRINVIIERFKQKKRIPIASLTLRQLIYATGLTSEAFLFADPENMIEVDSTSGTNTWNLPVKIPFGMVQNLRGDDNIKVTVQSNSPYRSTQDLNQAKIYFDVYDGVGVELYVPIFEIYNIPQNSKNPSDTIGDNVFELYLINTDKDSIAVGDQVVNNCQINSDKLSLDLNFSQLLSNNLTNFQTTERYNAMKQKFVLYRGTVELDKVTYSLTCNSANVNTDSNYFLAKKYYTDTDMIIRAAHMNEKHRRADLRKNGF